MVKERLTKRNKGTKKRRGLQHNHKEEDKGLSEAVKKIVRLGKLEEQRYIKGVNEIQLVSRW